MDSFEIQRRLRPFTVRVYGVHEGLGLVWDNPCAGRVLSGASGSHGSAELDDPVGL